jgi:uncharacterized protein YndB with AHSA1/START domain
METISLHRRVDLDLSVDELWELIADPDHLGEWLGDAIALDLAPGATGSVLEDGVRRLVHVDRVEHGHAIGFTWWEQHDAVMPSRVLFEIAAAPGGGSRLEITETLEINESPEAIAATAEERALRWEVRVCALWACTVVAALVP